MGGETESPVPVLNQGVRTLRYAAEGCYRFFRGADKTWDPETLGRKKMGDVSGEDDNGKMGGRMRYYYVCSLIQVRWREVEGGGGEGPSFSRPGLTGRDARDDPRLGADTDWLDQKGRGVGLFGRGSGYWLFTTQR